MLKKDEVTICIVGLGYVGAPLAVEFSKHFAVIGFDINKERIAALQRGVDPAGEIPSEALKQGKVQYTAIPKDMQQANFFIIAVPTPITENKKPDLQFVEEASKLVGKHMPKNAVVVYESTVYPGVTEEVCVPILEQESGMKCGRDFKVGYSPERINPGDMEHYLTKVMKLVSGMDKETTEFVATVYGTIIQAGIYKTKSIRVAEAAKVIENTQRDLNIALMNELALIFARMNINTKEVIDAAATKWNFHRYSPGLVGGHCISVDPHYLLYKAEALGYHPKVILAGRDVNNYIPKYVAEMVVKELGNIKKPIKEAKVLVMGLTFKEDVKDTRNSKIKLTIKELQEYGVTVFGCDPLLDESTVKVEFGIRNLSFEKMQESVDCIIIAKKHRQFTKIPLQQYKERMNPHSILVDLAYLFEKEEVEQQRMLYRTL